VAKHRVSATEVEAMQVIGDVEGRDVVLVDDMTETAGTLCAAAEILKAGGANRIFAAVTHAVIGELGHERIENSVIEEVITTDSTPVNARGKVKPVSIAPILGEAIQRIHNGESVTSLFDLDA
jgi:ribose-phosphate pyrophosphokinase